MTKEEAIGVLVLNDNAREVEINNKYNELFNEFQIRLTNAPTPNLKRLYQKSLQELLEARDILLSSIAKNELVSDLPNDVPIFISPEREKKEHVVPEFSLLTNKKSKEEPKKESPKDEENKTKQVLAYKKSYLLKYILSVLIIIVILSLVLLFKNGLINISGNTGPVVTSRPDSIIVPATQVQDNSIPKPSPASSSTQSKAIAKNSNSLLSRTPGLISSTCEKTLDSLKIKISKLNEADKINEKEMKQGLFCSNCMRTKSEIEASGEDFYGHINRSHVTLLPATQRQLAQVHTSYLLKKESLSDQLYTTKVKCEHNN